MVEGYDANVIESFHMDHCLVYLCFTGVKDAGGSDILEGAQWHHRMDPMDDKMTDHAGAPLHWEHGHGGEYRARDPVSECAYQDGGHFLSGQASFRDRGSILGWDLPQASRIPPAPDHFLSGRNPLINGIIYSELNQAAGTVQDYVQRMGYARSNLSMNKLVQAWIHAHPISILADSATI